MMLPCWLDSVEKTFSQLDCILYLIGEFLDVARIAVGVLSASPEPLDTSVLADRRHLEQVLTSLLANVARHSPVTLIRVIAAL